MKLTQHVFFCIYVLHIHDSQREHQKNEFLANHKKIISIYFLLLFCCTISILQSGVIVDIRLKKKKREKEDKSLLFFIIYF